MISDVTYALLHPIVLLEGPRLAAGETPAPPPVALHTLPEPSAMLPIDMMGSCTEQTLYSAGGTQFVSGIESFTSVQQITEPVTPQPGPAGKTVAVELGFKQFDFRV